LDGPIQQLSMGGGVFGCAREAGRRENHLFILEMLDDVMNQGRRQASGRSGSPGRVPHR
jgi:hypothetical protein